MKNVSVISIVAIAVIACVGTYATVTLQHKVDRLEPKATRYAEICDGMRWALHTDMTLLHDIDDPSRLTPAQMEQDRRHLYDRVGSYASSPPMALMLERCTSRPFPMIAWRACSNDACLRTILKQAMDSIP